MNIQKLIRMVPDIIPVGQRVSFSYPPPSSQPPVLEGPRIDETYFTENDVLITFNELGAHNPLYVVQSATLGEVTVSTASHFNGQSVITIGTEGSARTVLGSQPLQGVALSLAQGDVYIVEDGANPTSPVLSGVPDYNGPIAILFSCNVSAVALTGGFFDAIGATFIQAFDALGHTLHQVSNSQDGIESFGIRTLNGTASIRGISFYVNAEEPAGFAIDNLRFK